MEQLEHFPFPFDTQADALPAEEETPSGPDSTAVNVTIDLRRCLHTAVTHPYTRGAVPPATNAYAPAQEGEAASDAVRSLWVWPPCKPLATFALRWGQENAAQGPGLPRGSPLLLCWVPPVLGWLLPAPPRPPPCPRQRRAR